MLTVSSFISDVLTFQSSATISDDGDTGLYNNTIRYEMFGVVLKTEG